jgi:hypothetical protein
VYLYICICVHILLWIATCIYLIYFTYIYNCIYIYMYTNSVYLRLYVFSIWLDWGVEHALVGFYLGNESKMISYELGTGNCGWRFELKCGLMG